MAEPHSFDWDEGNILRVAEHDVEPDEAEDVFFDPLKIGIEAHHVQGERRFGLLGRTVGGRLLAVIPTLRGGNVRVVTARDA